jgi:hypothetical protein
MTARKRTKPEAAAITYDEAILQRLRGLIAEAASASDPDMELFMALKNDPAAREVAMAWLLRKSSTRH